MPSAAHAGRPLVGVTVDFLPARRWTKLTTYDRYVDAVHRAGGQPVILPPLEAELDAQLDLVRGVLLPGGDDLDPALWGEEPAPGVIPSDPRRTSYESRLVRRCVARGIPLLGICLGLQVLNVALGGSLVQRIPEDRVRHLDPALDCELRHDVDVAPGSVLARIAGRPGGGRIPVNSCHRQAPGRLGDGLVVTARAADGVIEALEHAEGRFCLGVQWHPDVDAATDPISAALFAAFVEACARR